MADKISLSSPLRLNTYRDEDKNTQVFQWVVGEYEAESLAKWKSVVSGANVVVEEVKVVDLIREMYFVVTSNPSTGNAVLFADDTPTITINGELDGTCTYGGDLEPYDIDRELFNTNSLKIYKNGVLQLKDADVFFVSDNHFRFTDRLQVGDVLVFDHVRGV